MIIYEAINRNIQARERNKNKLKKHRELNFLGKTPTNFCIDIKNTGSGH